MKTKYDTNDEVLVPVTLKAAIKLHGSIWYTIDNPEEYGRKSDVLIPEGMIEGKAKI